MIKREIGKMNTESMTKVARYFSEFACGTISEIGVSGSFMFSLVRRGLAKVIGEKTNGFVAIGNGLFRENKVNVYALTVEPEILWELYKDSKVELALTDIAKTKCRIEEAKEALTRAQEALSEIENLYF